MSKGKPKQHCLHVFHKLEQWVVLLLHSKHWQLIFCASRGGQGENHTQTNEQLVNLLHRKKDNERYNLGSCPIVLRKPKAIHNLLWGTLKGKYSTRTIAQIYKL